MLASRLEHEHAIVWTNILLGCNDTSIGLGSPSEVLEQHTLQRAYIAKVAFKLDISACPSDKMQHLELLQTVAAKCNMLKWYLHVS